MLDEVCPAMLFFFDLSAVTGMLKSLILFLEQTYELVTMDTTWRGALELSCM